MTNLKPLAIVVNTHEEYPGTFIDAHRRLLPFKIHYLYGGHIPYLTQNGDIISSNKIVSNLLETLLQKFRLQTDKEVRQKALKST